MKEDTSRNRFRSVFREIWAAGLVLAAGYAAQAGESLPFVTGFEPDDMPAYAAGDLHGQGSGGSWLVTAGAATVQTGGVARGVQAVEVGAGGAAEVLVNGPRNVVWTDVYLSTSGSPGSPEVPADVATSVLFFGETNGLWALDGNGTGTGAFVSVMNPLPTGRYVRVSIRQDYNAHTYDVWVDGTAVASDLGFKENSRTELQRVHFSAGSTSYLDDISVTYQGLDQDADDDYLVDLDEIKFHGTSHTNPDSDGDHSRDGDEVFVGMDPTDPASVFAADLAPSGGQMKVSFQTITGRLYSVQQLPDPRDGGWTNAPGLTDLAGDGSEKHLAVDDTPPSRDFRVSVREP